MIRDCFVSPRSFILAFVFPFLCLSIQAEELLFDGKSLDGWQGDPQHWRVDEGAIVGEIPPGSTLRKNTWLIWQGEPLENFDLRLQFRLNGAPAANSGIQFRCQTNDIEHVAGYQADLDMGATWLGRIYDEHGRALLVERGHRVLILPDGSRQQERFAMPQHYAVLFRENAWNDYRIVAVGEHVRVYINGTLFSELKDQQTLEKDLKGGLALQLHSGPETRIAFREIRLKRLPADDPSWEPFEIKPAAETMVSDAGSLPRGEDGRSLNLDFESGSLDDWSAAGDAFKGQPTKRDNIAQRWSDQSSNKQGDYFIGGFENVKDAGVGTLTSSVFRATHPYASCLIGGGKTEATRVELVLVANDGQDERVIATAVGQNREQMRRVGFDLREIKGHSMRIRLIDDSKGGWGHLNFDDFRFHDQPLAPIEPTVAVRSTLNPVLQHLVLNPSHSSVDTDAEKTTAQMFVPRGFSVDVVAAEPELHQPVAFAWDAAGRIWVVEGNSYPQKRAEGEGQDRILIFADGDGDGHFETRKVFAEKLNLVSGIEVGMGGVWLGAAPELLFIPDRNQDDVPDSPPQVMLDGFGYADTHETLNSFLWGPDGWLYGIQGVFNTSQIGKPGCRDEERTALNAGVWRYHPTHHRFEVFAYGGSNPWGIDYDDRGQLFMTHCRSFWGGGCTTHVMLGGHYWNQVNSGYASFLSPNETPSLPHMRNYLRASARYDHGAGGAGKPGTDEVYGGHSHVGTMIYLGNNWPAEYRDHLFTHNLHGHQINHQINWREAGGYHTVHAGHDVLFCSDPQYIGVDLQCGPDGAVYLSDWYDPRHCHNPNIEHWDRGNGRIYRMKFDETYQPARVDYRNAREEELIEAQRHPNDWHVRAARLVLQERAANGKLSDIVFPSLLELASTHPDPRRRLRGLWALEAIGLVNEAILTKLLSDPDEYVRGWAVQSAHQSLPSSVATALLVEQVNRETSPVVRRCLASSIQRLPREAARSIAAKLISQAENASDRDLPALIWCGLGPLVETDIAWGMGLMDSSQIASISHNLDWYSAKLSPRGRESLIEKIGRTQGTHRQTALELLELALRGMKNVEAPASWNQWASQLYSSEQTTLRRTAESIGAAFGDRRLFDAMRKRLSNPNAVLDAKKHALSILANDSSSDNEAIFLSLLDHRELVPQVLPLLRRNDSAAVAKTVIDRLADWPAPTKAMAIELLASRARWANQLLDAVKQGDVPKGWVTSFHARQMVGLGDEQLNGRIAHEWGNVKASSEATRDEIDKTSRAYKSAPLWAFNVRDGASHFQKLCANCHQAKPGTENIAPKLDGSGTKGIDYLIENVIDPNAVIGRDFQAKVVLTSDGQVLTGLVVNENDSAITLRTQTNEIVIGKSDIEQIKISENSFMPQGLLQDLNERERIELFKYLMTL